MDKLSLAHEYALKIIETHKDMFPAAKCVASYSFDYAEAMLAEEEKRRDKSTPVVLKG